MKTVYLAKPTLAFVIIDSDEYEGEGALHVSHVTRVKLESLENILHPGDALIATVSESTDERLQFSILEEIEIFVGTRYHEGEPINALLLNVRRRFVDLGERIWLSCVLETRSIILAGDWQFLFA